MASSSSWYVKNSWETIQCPHDPDERAAGDWQWRSLNYTSKKAGRVGRIVLPSRRNDDTRWDEVERTQIYGIQLADWQLLLKELTHKLSSCSRKVGWDVKTHSTNRDHWTMIIAQYTAGHVDNSNYRPRAEFTEFSVLILLRNVLSCQERAEAIAGLRLIYAGLCTTHINILEK